VRVAVLIPTYRRPEHLAQCLHALEQQTQQASQVLVVARSSDTTTLELLERESFRLPLQVVTLQAAGQVAALNAGLVRVEGEIVAMTDDDARPRPEWLQRIEQHFASDPAVGGVGGRDYVHDGRTYPETPVVGKIQWFGRHIGNHHRGIGPPRDVDVLKGANMSFRMSAVGSLRFDTRLLGAGAQRNNDMSFSLRLRRRGWRLVYDPAVAVDHFSAERFDDDGRLSRSLEAMMNDAYNETIAILEFFPRGRWPVFLAWSVLCGHRALPGCAQCVRLAATGRSAWSALRPVVQGRVLGVRALLRDRALGRTVSEQ
jgi:glycosyltransferase involved in cell wall biosynthesis